MNIVNSIEGITDEEKEEEYNKYNILAVELFDSISRNQSVIKFAKNPLLMTIVAMIFYQSKKLPNKRVELYDIATETFLDNWVRVRFQENSTFKDKGTILEILPHIAFHIHKNNSKGLISEDEFKKEFINIYEDINGYSSNSSEAKKEFKSFKEFLEHYTGFFYRKDIEGSLYGFVHLTFEEYLSALELKSKWDLDDLNIDEYVFEPRWIEVIRLAVANIKISNKGKSGRVKATQFINQILEVEDVFPEAFRTLQMTLLILADDIEVDSTAKEKILKNFIEAISEAKYFSLKKSFAKLYSELLFSIYKDELLSLTVNEILKNNIQFIENITQILPLINNKDIEVLFINLFFNEKERRKISFSSIENIYYHTFNKNVNNFLSSKKFLNEYRKYIIENNLKDYNYHYIRVYMSLNGFNILGNRDDNKIKKLYKFFNKEDNTILEKNLYYFLASSGSSNAKIFIHNIDIIKNTYFREKLLKIYSLYEENENRDVGHTSIHHNYTFLLKKQNDTKLIYDFEEEKVYEIKKTTQIKHSQFRGYPSSKKDELKLNIKYLQGDDCCSKKVDYFIYVYEEKDKLFNFFDWESFLLKNFSENYEKLSLILLENIVAYERYKDSEKTTYIEDIIKSEYFQDLIAPVQLFFLKQSNIEYDKSLIDNSLNYFRETKKEKLKNGIYHILYDILTPY